MLRSYPEGLNEKIKGYFVQAAFENILRVQFFLGIKMLIIAFQNYSVTDSLTGFRNKAFEILNF